MSEMRVRTDGNFVSSQTTTSTYYQVKPDGTKVGQSVSTSSTSDTDGMTRYMRDIVTPHFAERVGKGEVINNPMDSKREMRAWRGNFCQVEATFNANGYRTHQHWDNWGRTISSHLGLPSLQDLKLEAINHAWADVNAPTWCAGVDLGEFGETVALLMNPMRESIRLLSGEFAAASRGRKGPLRRSTVSVAPAAATFYLAYHLGLAPLFGSINDALKLLQREFLERSTARSTVRRTDRKTANYDTLPFTAGGQVQNWNGTMVTERTAVCRAGVLYVPSPMIPADYGTPWVFNHAGDFGLSKYDFLPTVWELIPFSFIVDRFINIGDFIRAMTAYLTVKPLASWCVTKAITTSHVDWDRISASPVAGYSAFSVVPPSSSSVLTTWDVERINNTNPGLVFSSRDIKLPTKILQNLDYLSLITLAFGNQWRHKV